MNNFCLHFVYTTSTIYIQNMQILDVRFYHNWKSYLFQNAIHKLRLVSAILETKRMNRNAEWKIWWASGKLINNQKLAHFIETHFNEEYFRNDMNYIKFSIKSPGTIWLQKCNRIFIPCNCCYMHTVWILWAFQRIKSHPLRKFHSIRLFDILYSPFLPRNDSIEAMNIFILETRNT